MIVKQLREALLNLPDNTAVVVPTTDHGYRRLYAAVAAVACVSGLEFTESCGGKCEDCEGKEIVIVVR